MNPRILGWDLLRFFSFIAIVYFHFTYWTWYLPHYPDANYSVTLYNIELYARTISFSGFTILLLSSTLWGLSRKKPKAWFYVFILLASVVLSYMDYEELTFSWDIYMLLFFGFLSLSIIKAPRILALFGFILLWIPIWQFRNYLSLPPWAIEGLIGICEQDRGDWALFPWIGLIWFGYGLGYELKNRMDQLKSWIPGEKTLWGVFLAISAFGFGPYFETRNGPGFSCDMFTQPPHILWAHLTWFMFFMRMSLLESVQNWLSSLQFSLWVSNLMISKKFWAAYFVHLIVIYIFNFFGDAILENEWIGLACLFAILPVTELILRLSLKLATKHLPTRKT